MIVMGIIQCALYFVVLLGLAWPLGMWMARIYRGEPTAVGRGLGWCDRLLYRLAGVREDDEMTWRQYAVAVLVFNLLGVFAVYGLQRFQDRLPFNPAKMEAVKADSAFNTAVSFVSNTNWQGFGGESTMSYLTQMLGLGVQNFVSAATGMAVMLALIRGLKRVKSATLGCFWVDLVRSTLYILLPLSFVFALILVSQGVVQSFSDYRKIALIEPTKDDKDKPVTEQVIPLGPAASQIAIKQLGTNGGGFFNANSAHPFENPTPLANFLEVLAILLIPAALCITFGSLVSDVRQGWALLAAMTLLILPFVVLCYWAEQSGNPKLRALGIDDACTELQAGGNFEGKEVRFGVANSALWATTTTAASNGSVNAMHDSFTPLGGLAPMVLMQLGEVVFGGVGCGLYGMIMFALVAVFVSGLMVGRTPEYLGKKIEAFEMKMASLTILIPPMFILVGTAASVVLEAGKKGISNPGAHGLSQVLYAFSSAGNNNGSAFGGISANEPYYNYMLGFAMLISRFWLIVPVLAIAGSLAGKKASPAGAGTLPTHGPLFVMMLASTVVIVGALTYVPALALGPIVEHLQMVSVEPNP